MPTFKDKSGKPRFSMNPQVGRSLYEGGGDESKVPGLAKIKEEHAPAEGLEDMGQSDLEHVQVHSGGHSDGEPPMHEGHTHHTIHMGDGHELKEIRNHEAIEGALDHVREVMDKGQAELLDDNGASDVADQAGESAVFE